MCGNDQDGTVGESGRSDWTGSAPRAAADGHPDKGTMPGSPNVSLIASCPIHGLHGCRDKCHTCGGPVDQIPMVELADLHAWFMRFESAVNTIDTSQPFSTEQWEDLLEIYAELRGLYRDAAMSAEFLRGMDRPMPVSESGAAVSEATPARGDRAADAQAPDSLTALLGETRDVLDALLRDPVKDGERFLLHRTIETMTETAKDLTVENERLKKAALSGARIGEQYGSHRFPSGEVNEPGDREGGTFSRRAHPLPDEGRGPTPAQAVRQPGSLTSLEDALRDALVVVGRYGRMVDCDEAYYRAVDAAFAAGIEVE